MSADLWSMMQTPIWGYGGISSTRCAVAIKKEKENKDGGRCMGLYRI